MRRQIRQQYSISSAHYWLMISLTKLYIKKYLRRIVMLCNKNKQTGLFLAGYTKQLELENRFMPSNANVSRHFVLVWNTMNLCEPVVPNHLNNIVSIASKHILLK